MQIKIIIGIFALSSVFLIVNESRGQSEKSLAKNLWFQGSVQLAQEKALKEDKLILFYFYSNACCQYCKVISNYFDSREYHEALAENYVILKIDIEDKSYKNIINKYKMIFNMASIMIADSDLNILRGLDIDNPTSIYVKELKGILYWEDNFRMTTDWDPPKKIQQLDKNSTLSKQLRFLEELIAIRNFTLARELLVRLIIEWPQRNAIQLDGAKKFERKMNSWVHIFYFTLTYLDATDLLTKNEFKCLLKKYKLILMEQPKVKKLSSIIYLGILVSALNNNYELSKYLYDYNLIEIAPNYYYIFFNELKYMK